MTTPYTLSTKIQSVTKSLEKLSIPLLSWFKENKLKLNLDKCHLIVSGTENAKIKLDDFTITNSKKEKYLALFSMINWSTNIILKICTRRRAVACCSFFRSATKENFIQCPFSVTV